MKKWIIMMAFTQAFTLGCMVLGLGQTAGDSLMMSDQVDSLLIVATTLWRAGKNEEALPVAQLALETSKQKWGENNAKYAASLHRLASVYADLWQNDKAEELYLKAIDLRAKVLGKEHPDYAWSLNNLANLYRDKGDYTKAEPLYLETKEIRAKTLGKEHPDYSSSLENLAILYYYKGDYANAEPLYLEAKEIRAKTLGKENSDYARSLDNLANLYSDKGDYAKAEPLYLEAKEIRAKKPGKEHPDYASSLDNLAVLYSDKGDYTKAEPLFWEAKEIRAKTLGKEHPTYASSLNNLAVLYWKKSDYTKAEIFYLEAKEIRAKTLGKEHSDYASSLNNLANLYSDKGDYAKAEPLYLEAKEIRAKTLGKEHPDYASSLSNLAILYIEKGDYVKAEPLYLEAVTIVEKNLGKQSLDYARYLHNLANLYSDKGDYTKAEPLFLEAKEIRAKTLGKEHPDYASSLNNLAVLYVNKGDYEKAELLYLEAKEIRAKMIGEEHPRYAQSLSNLAILYDHKGDYAKADSLYSEAKKIFTKALGKEHPDYATFLGYLILHYQKTNRIPESATLLLEANELNRRLIEKSAAYSSESQMFAYIQTFEKNLARFRSFAHINPSPEFNCVSFDNALFYNGFLLDNVRRLNILAARADSLIRDVFDRWQGCRRRLAVEYAKPTAERRYVAEVEAEAEGYEKTLTRNLPQFSEVRRVIHWQDVRDHLHPEEAAVEFIQYRYYTPQPTDSTPYAALVLRSGWDQPHFVPLFEEKQLAEKLNCQGLGNDAIGCTNRRYSPVKSSAVLRLLWQPFDSLLEGAKTIYYSPSGQLHWLDFGALSIGDGQTLSDKYRLVRLGSSRQLVVRDSLESNISYGSSRALLFGGIRYEADSAAIAKATEKLDTLRYFAVRGQELPFRFTDSTLRAGEWKYLPESATEIENIRLLLENQKIPFHTFSGFEATEEAFKRIGQSASPPRILHLATHGFFFPDPKTTNDRRQMLIGGEPFFSISEHPMIRSGLVLAGANHTRRTGKPYQKGAEDGILTAYEISQTNLHGTELVVLSACQTGLGDLNANEGVYGLQRAFKIAGARYLIMSLQSVPDHSTKEFMTLLYQNWFSKNLPLPDAFREAQTTMRKKYPDQPANWAGWVLME